MDTSNVKGLMKSLAVKRIIIPLICFAMLSLSACGKQTDTSSGTVHSDTETAADGLARFELSSDDLHDGVWDTIITNTEKGSNLSPQLSWEPVEGAESYVIYMVDTTANNWLHWRSENIGTTSLEQGSAAREQYVGPYPPSGTHTYVIYVYALKAPADNIPGTLDKPTEDFESYKADLDNTAGVLAYGTLSGTYTHGE